MDLRRASDVYTGTNSLFTNSIGGAMEGGNDYNPLDTSGLQPGCSLVYDAYGMDMVLAVTLQPGDTLHTELALTPITAVPAIYMMQGCPVTGWPDVNGSTMCGANEYASHGWCGSAGCDPLTWSFTWPSEMNGEPTVATEFFLVVDEVVGTSAERFDLNWSVVSAEQ